MKKYLLISFLFLICLSCSQEEIIKKEESYVFEMRLKDTKANCWGPECQTECYLVQEGDMIGSQEWRYFYDQIEGFTYEKGNRYSLIVRRDRLHHQLMDTSHFKYTLIEVLTKVPAVN